MPCLFSEKKPKQFSHDVCPGTHAKTVCQGMYTTLLFYNINFVVHVLHFNDVQIDENKAKYIENLGKAVAIKSVSAWPETRDEIGKMMKWMGDELKGLGADIEYVDLGTQTLPDGKVLGLGLI